MINGSLKVTTINGAPQEPGWFILYPKYSNKNPIIYKIYRNHDGHLRAFTGHNNDEDYSWGPESDYCAYVRPGRWFKIWLPKNYLNILDV